MTEAGSMFTVLWINQSIALNYICLPPCGLAHRNTNPDSSVTNSALTQKKRLCLLVILSWLRKHDILPGTNSPGTSSGISVSDMSPGTGASGISSWTSTSDISSGAHSLDVPPGTLLLVVPPGTFLLGHFS